MTGGKPLATGSKPDPPGRKLVAKGTQWHSFGRKLAFARRKRGATGRKPGSPGAANQAKFSPRHGKLCPISAVFSNWMPGHAKRGHGFKPGSRVQVLREPHGILGRSGHSCYPQTWLKLAGIRVQTLRCRQAAVHVIPIVAPISPTLSTIRATFAKNDWLISPASRLPPAGSPAFRLRHPTFP